MVDLMTHTLPFAAYHKLLDIIGQQTDLIPDITYLDGDLPKGLRGETSACPLAILGSSVYGGVEVNSCQVEVWTPNGRAMIDVERTAIERFVREFDGGRWPEYEEVYESEWDGEGHEGEWA